MDHECRQQGKLEVMHEDIRDIKAAVIGMGENDGIKTRVAIHDRYFKFLFWFGGIMATGLVTTALAYAFGG